MKMATVAYKQSEHSLVPYLSDTEAAHVMMNADCSHVPYAVATRTIFFY